MVKKMLETLVIALWACLAAYALWYFTLAKHYFPITFKEAKILWKIHKQHISCNAKKWRLIKHGNKIIGFECGCGYKHIQKRPIVANSPNPNIKSTSSEITAFEKLHTSYKSK